MVLFRLGGVRVESKIQALLATARIANMPSVLSNLLVGILLAMPAGGIEEAWPWGLGLAAVLFYVSGNFLNDWADRGWDVINRPERALPRGLFSSRMYLVSAVCGGLSGMLFCFFYGDMAVAVGAVLCGLIGIYTLVHKKVAWGVVPMGLCRVCLPVMGYVAISGRLDLMVMLPAIALFFYVVGLSMSARGEARGERSLVGTCFLWLSCAAGVILPVSEDPVLGWVGVFPFGLWLLFCMRRYRSPVSAHVSALLAGIPLVDGLFLIPLAIGIWGSLEGFVAIGSVLASFVAGRFLQRIAPAT